MSFDFAALMQFLMKLFDAFKSLAEKLGIVGGSEDTSAENA